MLADSLNVMAGHYGLTGEYGEALAVGAEALRLSDEIDNVWNQSFGRMHPSLRISPLAALGYLHLQRGEIADAETHIAETLDRFSPDNNDPSLLLVPYTVAELALAQQQPEKALHQMERFLDIFNKRSIRLMTALLYWQQGRAFLALQRPNEARVALARGAQIAHKLNARPSLWRVLTVQATLADLKGEAERAAALRREADDVIQTIADYIDDSDLREKYLQHNDVPFP